MTLAGRIGQVPLQMGDRVDSEGFFQGNTRIVNGTCQRLKAVVPLQNERRFLAIMIKVKVLRIHQ